MEPVRLSWCALGVWERARQSKISCGVLWKKRIRLTARNTSSLMISRLWVEARREDIVVVGLYCDSLQVS